MIDTATNTTDPARPKTQGRDYNARSMDLGNGRMQTQFHVKWINYLDEDRAWREIDPNFVETATGFEMTKAPFEVRVPLSARGGATFLNKNRWDVSERRLIHEPPLEQTMRALGVADVPGRIERGNFGWGETQYVVYPNAYPEIAADLIYWVHQGRVPRLRKFIRFREALARDAQLRFEIAFAEDVEMVNHGRSVTVRPRSATGPRANSLHSFYFWDSQGGWNGRRHIRFDMEPLDAARGRLAGDSRVYVLTKHNEADFFRVAGAFTDRRPADDPRVYVLTKHIEADFFRSAVLPAFTDTDFYPDEYNTPGATSVDGVVGYVGPDGTEWATVRNSAIGTDVSHTGITFRITTRKCESANMGRGITDFDTSALGAGAQIQSATLYLAQCFNVPAGDCGTERPEQITVGIVGHTPANPATLVVSDYTNGMTLNGAVEYAPRAIMANAPNAYTSFPLNMSGLGAINPTGNTNFMLRSQFDLDNINPGCVNRELQIYASEWVGTNLDPKLSVDYVSVPTDVAIDIKPGSDPNCFNIDGNGVIPVAILGSTDFDVTDVDIETLSFAGLDVRVRDNDTRQCSVEDVSGDFTLPKGSPDGYPDLVCQFVDDPTRWSPDEGTAKLTGNLLDGTPIEGTDSICLVP